MNNIDSKMTVKCKKQSFLFREYGWKAMKNTFAKDAEQILLDNAFESLNISVS